MFRFLSRPPTAHSQDDEREHEPLVSHTDENKPEEEFSPVLSDTGTAVEDSYQQHARSSYPIHSHSTSSIRSSPSARFWALVCVACATLNIVLAIVFPTVHLHSPSPFSASSSWTWPSLSSQDATANARYGLQPMQPFNMRDLSSLRRPSHFIGFHQIDRQAILASLPSSTPQETRRHQFDNYPVVVAQVYSEQGRGDEVMGVFTKRRMVRVGVVDGTEKWVFVNKTVRILRLPLLLVSPCSSSCFCLVYRLSTLCHCSCSVVSFYSAFVCVYLVHCLPDDPSWLFCLPYCSRLHSLRL